MRPSASAATSLRLLRSTPAASCALTRSRRLESAQTPRRHVRGGATYSYLGLARLAGLSPETVQSLEDRWRERLEATRTMGNTPVAATDPSNPRKEPIEDFSRAKHFVLQTPMVVAEGSDKDGWVAPDGTKLGRAVFATGCFWGTEKGFWKMPGMYTTAVGYIAGKWPNPTYEEVCSGRTGHTEAVQVYWDKSRLSFADVMRQYLQSHDPTQGMGQGNDRGTQYRSGVYPSTEEDATVARAAMAAYEKDIGMKLTAELIFPPPPFYYAEAYHQQYLARPGNRQYCSAQPLGVHLSPADKWLPAGADLPKLPQAYWDRYGPKEGCVLRDPHEQISWKL